jgi:hypothetical protein
VFRPSTHKRPGVDGRNTPGHDGEDTIPVTVKTLWIVLARSRLGSHAE